MFGALADRVFREGGVRAVVIGGQFSELRDLLVKR